MQNVLDLQQAPRPPSFGVKRKPSAAMLDLADSAQRISSTNSQDLLLVLPADLQEPGGGRDGAQLFPVGGVGPPPPFPQERGAAAQAYALEPRGGG